MFMSLMLTLMIGFTSIGQADVVQANEADGKTYVIGMDQTMAPFTFLRDARRK